MGQSVDGVLQLFRRLLGSSAAGTDDHELLDSFVRRRDERAFEELVLRHGPMVLGVCRRVLRDCHSADDAFQVTFLTLACKASSLRQGQALPAWLHRVACHIALRVRARGRRIEEAERETTPMPRAEPSSEAGWRELSAVLDEELQRLPEELRGPVVLCGLEGKTHEEAARELGWPTGSLSKRLARGRELLRQRLARRGFALGSAMASGGLLREATAAVAEGLLSTTVRAAVGQMAELSAATAALLREVLGTMFWTRIKVGVVVLLMALIAPVVGLTLFALGQPQPAPNPQAEAPVRQTEPPAPVALPGPGKLGAVLGEKQFRFRSSLLNAAYSPDGELLAISDGVTIHLYDSRTKKELRSWDGPQGFGIMSLAFSPDSKVLATASRSPRLSQWEVATGKLLREFDLHPSGNHFVTYSPDGKLLATAGEDRDPKRMNLLFISSDYAVAVWDATTGKKVASFGGAIVGLNSVAFSPDSRLLAWGGLDGKVRVCKVKEGKILMTEEDVRTFDVELVLGNANLCMDFSRDSKLLAVGNTKVIKLFDLVAGKEWKTLAHQPKDGLPGLQDGYRVRFSPDGRTLGSIGSTVALWDLDSGKPNRLLQVYGAAANELTFHPDGKKLAVIASDQSVRFWDLTTSKEEFEEGHRGSVSAVALSPDGKVVVTGSSDSVRFWDRTTGKQLRQLPNIPIAVLQYGRDGLLMLGIDRDGLHHLYDPETGKENRALAKELWGTRLAVSADGKLLAVGQEEIRVVELPSGKELVQLAGHGAYNDCMAFAPDGKTLVTGGCDTNKPNDQTYGVKLWDLSTGKELRTLQRGSGDAVYRVVWSPDGGYVLTNVRTYDFGPPPGKDLATCKVVDGPMIGRPSRWPGNATAFSPDGKLLAVGVNEQTYVGSPITIRIDMYDTTTWEKVAALEGHKQQITALAFSADGKFLVSGSTDTSARVWDVPERKK